MKKICCVTGHREIPAPKESAVKMALRVEIDSAIRDGYSHFMSGFADGVDLWFAEFVMERRQNDKRITLQAAIPYRKRLYKLFEMEATRRILMECIMICVIVEDYVKDCFYRRNRFMVKRASRVIAVYDGRGQSGTFHTMKEAEKLGRDIRIISI